MINNSTKNNLRNKSVNHKIRVRKSMKMRILNNENINYNINIMKIIVKNFEYKLQIRIKNKVYDKME